MYLLVRYLALGSTFSDCEELEMFVAEPQNQFLDLEMDFEEIDELSAAIAFTDEGEDFIDEELVPLMSEIREYIKDEKAADDFIVLSFDGLSENGK